MPQTQEIHLAITLVAISFLFISCQSVKIITDVYERLCPKINIGGQLICESNTFIEYAISLANLFTCINSSANFLVYMLRGKKFRDLFFATYCPCRRNDSYARGRNVIGGASMASRSIVYSIRHKPESDHRAHNHAHHPHDEIHVSPMSPQHVGLLDGPVVPPHNAPPKRRNNPPLVSSLSADNASIRKKLFMDKDHRKATEKRRMKLFRRKSSEQV